MRDPDELPIQRLGADVLNGFTAVLVMLAVLFGLGSGATLIGVVVAGVVAAWGM